MASIINSHFGANVEKFRVQITGKFWSNLIEIFNEGATCNYPAQEELDWLAVDGKSLRSTLRDVGDQSQNFVMIVALLSQRTGCVLNLKNLGNKKESEISQAQEIVRDCQFKAKVIIFDGLHCNQKTAALVIESGNDYIFDSPIWENETALGREGE